MIKPGLVALRAIRWQPFNLSIEVPGQNLAGAGILLQVRPSPDAGGAPLINLNLVSPPSEGISIDVNTSGDTPVSTINVRINETTIEGMPPAPALGDDAEFFYDMQVTRPGVHSKSVYLHGPFVVQAGVTH